MPAPVNMTIPPEVQKMRRYSDNSFYYFARYVLGYDKLVERVHRPICDMLQDEALTRVNITMPRKFFKTTLATIAYPLWKPCARNPNHTMLIAMNTVENAKPKLAELKNHVESNRRFRAVYPEMIPEFSKTTWGAERACLKRTGLHGTPTWTVAGATSAVVSGAWDELNLDDRLTANENESGEDVLPSVRDRIRAIRWFRKCISLLNDPLNGRINNVGTRWGDDDLVRYVLANNRMFAKNNYTLQAVNNLEIATDEEGFFTIVGGTATMPEVYPIETLNIILQHEGSTLFRLWYQNEPIDPAEIIFDLDPEENFYQPNKMEEKNPGWLENLRCYTACDLAYSNKEKADNTAIVTIGVDEEQTRYVLDVQYGKFQPMETVERLFNVYKRYKPRAMGLPVIAAEVLLAKFLPIFMRQKNQALPIRKMARGGEMKKEQRILVGIQPWVEQRMLKLARLDCMKPLEVEMRDFRIDRKRSGKRDALDALTDALVLAQGNRKVIVSQRPRYDREYMDKVRDKLYSPDADLDDLLAEEDRQRYAIGHPLAFLRN